MILAGLLSQNKIDVTPKNLQSAWEYSQKYKSMAVLVMKDGKVIFEKYANGGNSNRLQALASGSKSFCGTLAAAAVQDGLLTYDELVSDTFRDWKKDPLKSKVTIRQLLSLTSGLEAGKSGSNAERQSWEDAKNGKMMGKPGEKFVYGPNPFNTFGLLLETKLKGEKWQSYLDRKISKPLGIEVEYIGKCSDGNPQLAGGAWMKAGDWLKFGQFILQEGKWNGKQLIASELLAEMFKPSKANPSYGLTWWLNKDSEASIFGRKITDSNDDGFKMAAGKGKQRLYIISSQNLVAVRLGRVVDDAKGWSDQEFLGQLLGMN